MESGIQEDVKEEEEECDLPDPGSDDNSSTDGNDSSRPVSRVEIKHIHVEDGPINVLDILSHGERKVLGNCMIKLLNTFPKQKNKSRFSTERNVLTSGLSNRRQRHNKKGSYALQMKMRSAASSPGGDHHRHDKNRHQPSRMRNNSPDSLPPENDKRWTPKCPGNLIQMFPQRKPSTRMLIGQPPERNKCDCRKMLPGQGPPLKIQGKQAAIFVKMPSE